MLTGTYNHVNETFLDLAGVEPHPRMQGRSLRPLLAGQPGDEVGWRTAA